jgi:hypothetical protein
MPNSAGSKLHSAGSKGQTLALCCIALRNNLSIIRSYVNFLTYHLWNKVLKSVPPRKKFWSRCQDMDSLARRNYILHQYFVIYMRYYFWALDNPCWCIMRVIYLCDFPHANIYSRSDSTAVSDLNQWLSCQYWYHNLINAGKLIHSFNWLLILWHFAHQSVSWNIKLQAVEIDGNRFYL